MTKEEDFNEAVTIALQKVPEDYKEAAKFIAMSVVAILDSNKPPSGGCGVKIDFDENGADLQVLKPEKSTAEEDIWANAVSEAIEALLYLTVTFNPGSETIQ